MIAIDNESLNIRQDYLPKFIQARVAKRAANFCEVRIRLKLILSVQPAAFIPEVQ
jgi:hypothetical protein